MMAAHIEVMLVIRDGEHVAQHHLGRIAVPFDHHCPSLVDESTPDLLAELTRRVTPPADYEYDDDLDDDS